MTFAAAAALLATLWTGAPGARGDTLTGRVTDRDGNPVPGAVVLVAELHRVTVSDAAGAFRLADLPDGRYTVIARAPGFAPVARVVTVAGPTTLALALERSEIELEPVTVTATRDLVSPLASSLPATTLSGEDLRRARGPSLAHTVADLPGVAALTTGAQVGKPVIRGLSGPRVLVLDDGSRLEDYSWSDEDGPSADARLASRIELIRGPASVLYGSDAEGGVINVIPEELPDANGGPGFVRSAFEVSGSTNNGEVGGVARIAGAGGAWGWRVTGVGRIAGDLHTPAGALDNTGFNALSGEAAVGRRGERGSTTLRYTRYGGEFKLLEAEGPAAGETGGPERKLSDDRLQLAGDYLVGPLRLETRAQWERHWLAEVADTGTSPSGTPLEGTAFDLLLNTLSADVLAHHRLGDHLGGTAGISALYQTNATRGPEPLVPGARLAGAALFAFEQETRGPWSVLAGARVDARRLSADSNAALALSPQQRDYTAVSGTAGLVFRPLPSLAVSANLGRAWRAPTLFELFANGPHAGEARYEIGDPTLRPETGTDLDAGVRWQSARVQAELTGYRNALDRYIYITPAGQVIDSLPVYRYVQADALLVGGEASATVAVAPVLSLRARVDAVRATNRATDQPLPLTPPARAALGAEVHARGARFGAEVETWTRQTRLAPLDSPTAGYTLLHLDAGLDRVVWGRTLHVDVTARNVTDVAYRSYLSRYKAFALDPGRNLTVRLSLGE